MGVEELTITAVGDSQRKANDDFEKQEKKYNSNIHKAELGRLPKPTEKIFEIYCERKKAKSGVIQMTYRNGNFDKAKQEATLAIKDDFNITEFRITAHYELSKEMMKAAKGESQKEKGRETRPPAALFEEKNVYQSLNDVFKI